MIYLNMLCVVLCTYGMFRSTDFLSMFLNSTGFFLNLSLVLKEYL